MDISDSKIDKESNESSAVLDVASLLDELSSKKVFVYVESGKLRYRAYEKALDEKLKQNIKRFKEQIISYLDTTSTLSERYSHTLPEIVAAKRPSLIPLSFSQQRLWFLDILEQGSAQYNIPGRMVFQGEFSREAFEKAFKSLLERHEILRTNFQSKSGTACQIIKEKFSLPCKYEDISGFSDADKIKELRAISNKELNSLFDLSKELMVRCRIVKLSSTESVLVYTMHHIVSDGWSIGIFRKEMRKLYLAYLDGRENPLKPLPIQYADYTIWQRDWLQSSVREHGLAYWKKQLSKLPLVHSFPTDKKRPARQSYIGRSRYLNIPELTTKRINQLGSEHNTTLFMFMQTILAILLSRYSGEKDIAIGTAIAGRTQSETENLIGFFVNDLVIRTKLESNPSFISLLLEQKKVILEAYTNQHIPFEMLVEEINPERSNSCSPLFQIKMDVQNNENEGGAISTYGNAKLATIQRKIDRDASSSSHSIKHDLYISVVEDEKGLNLAWRYSTDLFFDSTIDRLIANFSELINSALTAPEQPIQSLNIITSKQYENICSAALGKTVAYPKDKCFHHLFEDQAKKSPDSTALVYQGKKISYLHLNESSNQLARLLIQKGVSPDCLVGLCLTRSIDMVIGLIAILKAGGAYIPLDPNSPPSRLEAMLADSDCKLVLTETEFLSELSFGSKKVLPIDGELGESLLSKFDKSNIEHTLSGLNSSHLAYVIYTSGSTGKPKGVQIPHASLLNYLTYSTQNYLTESNGTVVSSSLSFDATVTSLLSPLIIGQPVHLLEEGEDEIFALAKRILQAKEKLTFKITPAHLEALYHHVGSKGMSQIAHQIVVGGESLNRRLVEKWKKAILPKAVFVNEYGPTETVVGCCTYLIDELERVPEQVNTIPIGQAISNSQLYVVNSELKLVPAGVYGELLIGGDGLARSYRSGAGITAAKFVPNPFCLNANERVYRSGDVVRWLTDEQGQLTNLEYRERLDGQIKIRGLRVEIGEVNHALLGLSGVLDATAVIHEEVGFEKRLIAYVVTDEIRGLQIISESDHLQRKTNIIYRYRDLLESILPSYMVPSVFIFVDELPLTNNGKVDLAALPKPDESDLLKTRYVAPKTETEVRLTALWKDVLKLTEIGVEDNFFSLGGHSLLATRLINLIRQEFSIELPLVEVFDAPTILTMSKKLDVLKPSILNSTIEVSDRNELIPLSFAQQRLWFIDQLEGSSLQYHIPGRIAYRGEFDSNSFQLALEALIQRHEVLRTCFTTKDGHARQVIKSTFELPFVEHDLSKLQGEKLEHKVRTLITQEFEKPFNLTRDLMIRVGRLKLSEEDNLIIYTMHHIASDGWSIAILRNELDKLYNAFSSNKESPLEPLQIHYADYSQWQHNRLQGEVLEEHLSYWRERLADLPHVHSIPLDKPRPEQLSFSGRTVHQHFDKELSKTVNRLCDSHDVTLFILLQTVFALFISRFTQQQDIVMGSPISGRNHKQIEPLIGFFVNTIVLRTEFSNSLTITELLTRNKKSILEAYTHQDIPFEMLVDELNPERNLSHNALVQVLFAVQNNEQYAVDSKNRKNSGDTNNKAFSSSSRYSIKFDLELVVVENEGGISLAWGYNDSLFEEETVFNMAKLFGVLLDDVVADLSDKKSDKTLGELKLLSPKDNESVGLRPQKKSKNNLELSSNLIERKAVREPNLLAFNSQHEQLTYSELNIRSNQLANYLLSQGVSAGTKVGVSLGNFVDHAITLLSVLKIGAVYLPIDSDSPLSRLKYVVEDSQLEFLVAREKNESLLNQGIKICIVNEEQPICSLSSYSGKNLKHIHLNNDQSLSAIIYTMDSFGTPKGLLVDSSLCDELIEGGSNSNTATKVLVYETLKGNISIQATQLFRMLLGEQASFDILNSDCSIDNLIISLTSNAIEQVWIPAIRFEQLIQQQFEAPRLRQIVITEGKASNESVRTLKQINPKIIVINNYSDISNINLILSDINSNFLEKRQLESFCTAENVKVDLFDSTMSEIPKGAIGELYISGPGVPAKYINDAPDKEVQLSSLPMSSGFVGKYYKTGMMFRKMTNGYFSKAEVPNRNKVRKNTQQSILNCQSQIRLHPQIRNAVVDPVSTENHVYLTGYALKRSTKVQDQSVLDNAKLIEEINFRLRTHPKQLRLPHKIVFVDEIPVFANGQIDKKTLFSERDKELKSIIKPANQGESILIDIWAEVLLVNVDSLCVEDNFFELGGDSILSIQVVSRAAQRGVHFSVKDLFTAQTIRKLAKLSHNKTKVIATQEPVSGTMNLLPIQTRFFADETELHHFNQSFFLRTPKGFNEQILIKMLSTLIQTHDALRLSFKKVAGEKKFQATFNPFVQSMVDEAIEIININKGEHKTVENKLNRIQRSMDLENGRIIKAVYIVEEREDESQGFLVLMIHHLVVDGVSWRILLADIETMYGQVLQGVELSLPAKTSSYFQWSAYLQEQDTLALFEKEKVYWQKASQITVNRLEDSSVNDKSDKSRNSQIGRASFKLDKVKTKQLLAQSNQAYRTQINELLLSGLLLAISRWCGEFNIRVDMEGHGRENLSDKIDLTRTVGWFTSIYPFTMRLDKNASIAELVCGVKEQYRAIPNNGIGFGVLQEYVNLEKPLQTEEVEIAFNYLGQFSKISDNESSFSRYKGPTGDNISKSRKAFHKLSLTGSVTDERLGFTLTFDKQNYSSRAMQELLDLYSSSLQDVIKHCVTVKQNSFTPSDFPLAKVNQKDIDLWQKNTGDIEDIYPATGMQQGLLFHTLLQPGSYVSQNVFEITSLDLECYKRAWQRVIDRNSIFRTCFVGLESSEIHQLVKSKVELLWSEQDLSHMDSKEQIKYAEEIRQSEKHNGIDIARAPLMRLAILNLGEKLYQVVWSHHHALLDGWCLPLVLKEVSVCYSAFVSGKEPELEQPQSYRDYASWLANQNQEEARQFWKKQVKDIEGATPLPLVKVGATAELKNDAITQITLRLDENESLSLTSLAKSSKTTLNIIVEAAWALLISRYSGESRVVFGAVTSGRPAQLPGVEKMIGLFINTLPVIVDIDSEISVHEWLGSLHKGLAERESFNFYPLIEILKLAPASNELFDSLVVFENYPIEKKRKGIAPSSKDRAHPLNKGRDSNNYHKAKLDVESITSFDTSSYSIALVAHVGKTLSAKLVAKEGLLSTKELNNLAVHLKQLLLSLVKYQDLSLKQVNMLSKKEINNLVYKLNRTKRPFPDQQSIGELFEAQVNIKPEATAIVFQNEHLSYHNLNMKANELAAYLLSLGVGDNSTVAISLPRSTNIIISILSVLKIGGIYLPIDPDYPADRIEYMLENSQAELVIDSEFYSQFLSSKRQEIASSQFKYQNVIERAYSVIYTSGSSGKPKGVLLSQLGLLNHINNVKHHYQVDSDSRFLQFFNVAFDAAAEEIFTTLCHGATLVMRSEDLSLENIYTTLNCQQVTHADFSTAYFQSLFVDSETNILSKPLVACGIGGEKVDKEFIVKNKFKLKKFAKKLFNVYGPTEATLTATIFDIFSDQQLKNRASLPIGKPYANRDVYIVDKELNLVPEGVSGELLIGGVGVAIGYANNPALTAEKFIDSPFHENNVHKLYRTGDLVRYLEDGNLAYLGRIDNQVKIRGFRIELGEIEQQILVFDDVYSCVAIVREDEPGFKKIVAYITLKKTQEINQETIPKNSEHQQEITRKLALYLKEKLPDYMLPSDFVVLDSIPLTPNGKTDVQALPVPATRLSANKYVEPTSNIEKQLVEIWAELLNLDKETLGVTENFFEIGGDSILSIQVVARAAQAEMFFSVKDLFDAQTVQQLALLANSSVAKVIPQNEVVGSLPLLPIQRHFLKDDTDFSHFNQSFILSTPDDFNSDVLKQIVEQLLISHDALRLKFSKDEGSWGASHLPYDIAMLDKVITVKEGEVSSIDEQVKHANILQKQIAPSEGQLIRLLYQKPTNQGVSNGLLLIIIHHLVVDGVSWRVILSDLELLFSQWKNGQALELPAKTTSYQQWGYFLNKYANSQELIHEAEYWKSANQIKVRSICKSMANKELITPNQSGFSRVHSSLNKNLTNQLIGSSNKAYRTQVNELLLSALLLGINRWGNHDSIRLDMEGHGREELTEGLDLSRTVGWFTTLYPLTLSVEEPSSIEDYICSVKEQYRAIPNKGIGYGILKEIVKDETLQASGPSELLFNYLGQMEQSTSEGQSKHSHTYFGPASAPSGQNTSSLRKPDNPLAYNANISRGCFESSILFDRSIYDEVAMQDLLDHITGAIAEIVEHCEGVERGKYTPSDFLLSKVSVSELAQWNPNNNEIEDIYPATGMQQGLLFHSLLEQGSYNTQTIFDIDDLDIELYQKAWQELVNRNSIFRTAFVGIDSGNAHQLVKSKVSLPFSVENLKTLSTSEQNDRVEEIRRADKLVSFEPSEAPLMRMTALRLEDKRYKIIWSSHHALLDAWSTPLVMKEVTECYRALKTDEKPKLEARLPYRNYVAWLADQNLTEAREYWSKQLLGIESATNLPLVENSISQSKTNEIYQYRLSLTDSQSIRLSKLAQTCKVTVNVIVQAVWGLLLSRYSGTNKVIFGSTSSGRPAQLSGVEKMIGLFINTLPVVIDIEQEMTIENWLQTLHQSLAERETYNYLSLFEIQQLTSMKQALFDSLILFENVAVNQSKTNEINESALKVQKVKSFEGTNFGITLMATMSGNLFVELEVKKNLMPESSVKQIGEHLKQLLVGVSKSKDTLVREIEMLTYQEKKYLQTGFNQTKVEYPYVHLVHQLIEEQARLTPDTVALIFEQHQISYQELNRRANRLANYLILTGCGPETKVAICIERSIDMMIGLLGILKSGACYIPLDPGYPDERISYIIEDSGVSTLITSNTALKKIELERISNSRNSSNGSVQALDCVIVGEEKYSEDSNLDLRNPTCISSPSNLAYIIYTSGSTGKPKGVRVTNDNLVNFLSSMKSSLNFNRNDRLLAVTTLSFDISGLELYLPLICGTSVDVAESGRIIDGEKLAKRIQDQKISVLQATPVTWKILLDSGWEGKLDLKALVGGEAFPKELSEKLMPKVSRLWNMYGPTETTIWSTMYELTKSKVATYIGSPISNTDVYVLDKDLQLCPVGVPGELYVGGSGVAQGYHNKAGLSAERFVPHLYCKEPGERLYRTGDIVRHMPEGGLDYIGREDFQVKVRGVRIELGEIESALLRNDYVKDVVVKAHRDESGDQKLVAHVVADHTKQEEQKDLDMSLLFFAADEAETQENKYQLYVDSSKRADELGFTAIWTPERHFHEVAGLYPNPSILSSALAMVTKDIQLRAGSVVLPLHNPLRVAEEWSVVDNLSNGRVGVGFVSGWVPADFALSPNNYHDKREIMFDGINKVQELWRGNKISVKNGLDQDIELGVYPRPVQEELPVWLTCAGDPRMFQEAGELGYNILTALLGQTVEEAAEKIALYRQALIANGHDPATKTVTMMLHTYLHAEQEIAIEKSRGPFCEYMKSHIGLIGSVMDDLTVDDIDIKNQEQLSDLANMAFERYLQGASLIGSPESCQPMISKMKEIGVDEVACLIDFGVPTSDILEGLESINELQTQQSNTFVPKAGALKLKEQLQRELPAQLVPNMFVFLEELPLTNNGKIDRNALQAPNILDSQNDYAPPTTKTEIVLVDIWSDVLQMPDTAIGISNSFFDIGGHSLLAIKLVAKINESLDTTVLLSDVFRLHDIARLGSYIDELKSGLRDDQHDIKRLGTSQDIHNGEDLEEFDL